MTREQVKDVLKYISSVYPSFRPDSMTDTVNAWVELLETTDYEIFMRAVKKTIMGNNTPFAPTIGQLREQYQVEYRMSHKTEPVDNREHKYIPMPDDVRKKLERFKKGL